VTGAFRFELLGGRGGLRRGRCHTPHGSFETPAFAPVGTYGAVKGLTPEQVRATGTELLLANSYHLHLRPGAERIERLGGLHRFMAWDGPLLTDSGGYQVFSLAERVRLDEDGVTFASPLDGSRRRLTPEGAVAIQEALGADVAVALDHCVPSAPGGSGADLRPAWRDAMERSLRWAERCARARRRGDQALFGIVQGGADPALRRASAAGTASLDFDGFAHGGLGLGEAAEARGELLAESHAALPAAAPRYLMGLGHPADLVLAVERGVDLFDCVVPTRHGRHAVLFTRQGPLSLKNARYREDPAPPEADCDCPTCQSFGRAYLRHLFACGDLLAPRLATLHNLRFYYRLLAVARAAIAAGRFRAFRDQVLALAGARGE
jgi:queuine tRNA-ribosyltransferase